MPKSLIRFSSVGWTPGQYSLFRILFGAYLLIHFSALLPWAAEVWSGEGMISDRSAVPTLHPLNVFAWWDGPIFVTLVVGLAAAASISFGLGFRDRVCAVFLWYVLACLFGRNPLTLNPSLPFVGWMLLAHVFFPAAPYGSIAARKRIDPGNGWRVPARIFGAAWIVMAVGYTYSGYTKLVSPSWLDGTAVARVLENPLARPTFVREAMLSLPPVFLKVGTWGGLFLEIAFAPLALFRLTRPWVWLAMLLMHLQLLVLIDFADLSLGMIFLHFFTFNPAWVRGANSGEDPDTVFYDGGCGLCHRVTRFVLAEDESGSVARFAPLQGETFAQCVPLEKRQDLPYSIAVLTADGRLLLRTAAIVRLMLRLGGVWAILGFCLRLVPLPIVDKVYDGVAAIRHRLFETPKDACPLLPPHLRSRFGA